MFRLESFQAAQQSTEQAVTMSVTSHDPRHDAGATGTVSGGTVFARVIVIAVVGGLAAMLAHFAISRMTDVFHLPPELTGLGGGNVPGADDQARLIAGQQVLFYKHTSLWLGSAGAILGALFGLALGLLHAATWLVVGAGVGIGVGLGAPARRVRHAAMSMLLCAIAGMMGGTLYLVLAGIVVPLADTTVLIPTGASERLLWLALPSSIMGLVLGRKG
jgi:hypothetical protein